MKSILTAFLFMTSLANLALGFYLGSIGFPGLFSADDTGVGLLALFFCVCSLASIAIAMGAILAIFSKNRAITIIFSVVGSFPALLYILVNTPVDSIVPGKVTDVCKFKNSEPSMVGFTYNGHISKTALFGPFALTGSRNFYFLFPDNSFGIRKVRIRCDQTECAPIEHSKEKLAEITMSLKDCEE